jgi:hypothetical protein
VQRDGIDPSLLASPAELWNRKIASYRGFLEACENGVLTTYESLLRNPEALYETLSERFGVDVGRREVIEKATKSDELTIDDYRRRYLESAPARDFRTATLERLEELLDEELVTWCGYRLTGEA